MALHNSLRAIRSTTCSAARLSLPMDFKQGNSRCSAQTYSFTNRSQSLKSAYRRQYSSTPAQQLASTTPKHVFSRPIGLFVAISGAAGLAFATQNKSVYADAPLKELSRDNSLDVHRTPSEVLKGESKFQKQLKHLTKNMTLGSVLGLCTGFFMKNVSKLLAIMVGVSFVAVQFLVHTGVIKVNWQSLNSSFEKKRPLPADKDAPLSERSRPAASGLWWLSKVIMAWLVKDLPFGASFTSGFVLGFRYG